MMGTLKELLEKTKELYDYLQSFPKKSEERDSFLEKVNLLLDEREVIMKNLPKGAGDDRLKTEIIRLSKEIDLLLETHFNLIKSDIKNIKNQKKVVNKYNKIVSNDGMFFDKRK